MTIPLEVVRPFPSWLQYIRKHRAIIILIITPITIMLIVFAYWLQLNWTGFPSKTLWDWLNLLGILAIPAVVGFGTVWFTTKQSQVSNAESKDNQREAALQGYIDKMSELLLHENLRDPAGEEARKVARTRTLTVLRRLDKGRQRSVLQFLFEAELISKDKPIIDLNGSVLSEVDLSRADLSGADLSRADLSGADLRRADLSDARLSKTNFSRANLSGANLKEANLTDSSLEGAFLIGANLEGAVLTGAVLEEANLTSTHLEGAKLEKARLTKADLGNTFLREARMQKAYLAGAYLKGADLREADLREADLQGNEREMVQLLREHPGTQISPKFIVGEASLEGANLEGANLEGARVTQEQLKQAKSLKGAIMPDGSKYSKLE